MKLICSLFITFLKIGAFTFGGGYAMIALLENEFVEKKKWLEKSEFLDMVAVAESTPGPVAINSATYIGYKIAGFAGATMSTLAVCIATVYKGNIIKNLIMDCQSYTKYRPNETTGGIFVSWRRKEELPTGA